jgi:hypothetical protein
VCDDYFPVLKKCCLFAVFVYETYSRISLAKVLIFSPLLMSNFINIFPQNPDQVNTYYSSLQSGGFQSSNENLIVNQQAITV